MCLDLILTPGKPQEDSRLTSIRQAFKIQSNTDVKLIHRGTRMAAAQMQTLSSHGWKMCHITFASTLTSKSSSIHSFFHVAEIFHVHVLFDIRCSAGWKSILYGELYILNLCYFIFFTPACCRDEDEPAFAPWWDFENVLRGLWMEKLGEIRGRHTYTLRSLISSSMKTEHLPKSVRSWS